MKPDGMYAVVALYSARSDSFPMCSMRYYYEERKSQFFIFSLFCVEKSQIKSDNVGKKALPGGSTTVS